MYKYCKRVIDLFLIIIFLPVWLFIYLVVAFLIYVKLGKPVLFTQKRLGQNGHTFFVYKFRTMTNEKDKEGNLLDDHIRLTSFGKFLRASSLDELPSLFNVIKGEMAIVGPRPFIAQYKDLYSDFQMRRHEVKPGITGWAQVNGRNAITWEQKFKYDVWYVDNMSFWIDLKIVFKTIRKVIISEGINSGVDSTMEFFKGNN